MPGVRCPIKNCSYVTPDDVLHLELIIALLQLHGKEHDQPAYATKKVECPTLSASEASGSGDVAAVIKSSDPQPHRKERDQPADATKKCTTSSPSEALDCDASGSGDVHEVPSKSSATSASHCLVTSEPTMKGSVSSPPPSDDVVHVQSVTNTTAVHLLPWPVKFRIPKEKFRASLVRALGECRPLTASEKEKLMDSLYDAVTRYTYRPKPVQYTEVISCLLTSYPALKNGLVGQDAMGYWKKSLSNRFRNSRKRHERDNPLAQMGKKTRVTTKPDQPSKQMYMHPQQKKSPSVTASSSDKATHLQTMQQNTSVTSKSNTGVNEGTMTELTWIELPRKLVQSKDASTQWEQQPPTHSTQAASTSSTQDLDKPSCGDDGELEQDGLGWCSEDTPAVQEDEFMDSSEPSDVHIDGSIIVAGSRGHVEETTVVESQEGKQSKTPILRRMIDELIDEEVDYQTVYVKEEYFEDECQDDDYAHVHLTPGGHPRLDAESPRSTQQTNSDRAPRQNGGPCIGSKEAIMAEATLPRFELRHDDQLQDLIGSESSKNTKKSVKFSVKIFEDYLQIINTDLNSVNKLPNLELDKVLQRFYAGARQKNGSLYTKKSMQSIRYGLQRFFLISKNVDIGKHEDFTNSKSVFKQFFLLKGQGVVNHKPAISQEDMDKIQGSLDLDDPQGLQDKVFIDVMLYFCILGRENIRDMTLDSFEICEEALGGKCYITLKDTLTRNSRADKLGGVMTPTNGPRCPVASFLRYKDKLNPKCKWFWQRPAQHKREFNPSCSGPWYCNAPLGKNSFGDKMKTISSRAGTKAYTNHCLRVTSISTLQNAGFRDREIMSVSGKKAESSLKHYASITSSTAKENMSRAIAAAVDPKSVPSSSNISHGIAAAVDPKSVPSTSTSTGGQRSESQELRELNEILNEMTNNPENFLRTCNITTSSQQSPSVTASSSDKATHLQTMQQNTSVTSKSNTGVNEGTMTDLTWIELLRKLVQSKDASTQWEKQPPTHSTQAASTSSTQDLDKPSCGDDGELEQDDLGWSSQDTPAGQEDEFMDSSEASDLHIDLSTIVAGYRGFVEETTVAESQEGEQNNSPILRRIKEEMIDEFEEGDYQTLYVKEEYLEDECQDDDYAHVHLTPGKASHKHMVVQYMLLPNVLTQTECLARP
eukprot:XP_011667128.1 PREDICTED: uncharacterized protein LOC764748 isoform X2 [Strongylocentrotus purpuratus]